MDVTLKCFECGGEDLVKPRRLNRKAILTCRQCAAIALYGDLLEAQGRRLMAELKQRLPLLEAV